MKKKLIKQLMLTMPIAATPLLAASCSDTKANDFLFRYYTNGINKVPKGLLGIHYFANSSKLMGYSTKELAYLNVKKTTNPTTNDTFSSLTINKASDFNTTNSLTPADPTSFNILTKVGQESLSVFQATNNSTNAIAITQPLLATSGGEKSELSLIKGVNNLTASSSKFVYSYTNKLPGGGTFTAAKGIPGTNDSVIACDSKGKVHFISDLKNDSSTVTTAGGTKFDTTSEIVGMQIIPSTGSSCYVIFATTTKIYKAEVNKTDGAWTSAGVTDITPSDLPTKDFNFFTTYKTSDNKVYLTSNQGVFEINADVTAATKLSGLTYNNGSKNVPYDIHSILKEGNKYYFTTESKGILTASGLSSNKFQNIKAYNSETTKNIGFRTASFYTITIGANNYAYVMDLTGQIYYGKANELK